MAILITGGAGYIGSHMVHRLSDRGGASLVVLDDLSTGFEWAIPAHVPLVKGNVGDFTTVVDLIRRHSIDTVLHFAASTVVPESVHNPLKYYSNNTANSLILLRAATESGVSRFVFSSTAAVYGEGAPSPTPEDAPTAPASPYGWSKLMTERMIQDAANASGMRFVILRYFNACGADPQLRSGQSTRSATHLIKVAAEAAVGVRRELEIYGSDYPTPDGTCIRDYVHVADLVEAHALSLDYLAAGGRSHIFNCGYGRGYSVREVLDSVQRISGANFVIKIGQRRPGDQPTSIADSRRLRNLLKWSPRFDDLDTIVRHAIAWEQELTRRAESGARVPDETAGATAADGIGRDPILPPRSRRT